MSFQTRMTDFFFCETQMKIFEKKKETKKHFFATKCKFSGSKTTLVPTDFQRMDKNTNKHRNIFQNIFIGVAQNKVIQVSNNTLVSK